MPQDDKVPTFEEAYGQLRETVQALEAGNLSLEDAMRLFDTGMKLAKTCNELLSSAEIQVSRLQRSFGEQMAMIHASEQATREPDTPDESA